ncbi:unnamed protein product, partial [Rotaria sp. Silwood2]
YICTKSLGIIDMRSFPSDTILNDPIKRNIINQLFSEIKMDLTSYILILSNSIIKDKQILTINDTWNTHQFTITTHDSNAITDTSNTK